MDAVYTTGILRSWDIRGGFGFIESPTNVLPLKRFFLHLSEIQCGPNPPIVGSLVRFETKPSRKPGHYPLAVRAWVIDPNELNPSNLKKGVE